MQDSTQPTTPPALPFLQKRIAALSVVGDNVWRISEPVLHWMMEHGDEDLSHKALATLLAWAENQAWFIEWGNKTGYFLLAEQACHDLAKFKQAMKTLPFESESQKRIVELALMTGEVFNKPIGMKIKNVFRMKRQRHSRGKRR